MGYQPAGWTLAVGGKEPAAGGAGRGRGLGLSGGGRPASEAKGRTAVVRVPGAGEAWLPAVVLAWAPDPADATPWLPPPPPPPCDPPATATEDATIRNAQTVLLISPPRVRDRYTEGNLHPRPAVFHNAKAEG